MLYQIFSISDMAAEIESNPRGHMRQPRTLGLAIVPGDHVVSIAIAKGFVTESPRAPPDPESPRTATDPSPPHPESLQTCTNLNSPQVTPSDPTQLEMKSRQIHTNLESQSHVGDPTHPESPQLHISDLTHPESPQSHVGGLRQLEPESLQVSTDLTQPGAEPSKIQCETKQVTSSELESNADL